MGSRAPPRRSRGSSYSVPDKVAGHVGVRRRLRSSGIWPVDTVRDHEARAGIVGTLVDDIHRRQRNRRRLEGGRGVESTATAAGAEPQLPPQPTAGATSGGTTGPA
jgi:hypothetical protein